MQKFSLSIDGKEHDTEIYKHFLFSEKLSEAQAQAAQREKMAVIGTLSAGINHEICNPLGIARGQCEMFLLNLKEGIYDDRPPEELIEKAREIMEKVINEMDRATVITKKLSLFAKPSNGTITNDVNVRNELKEVISFVEHDLKLDNISIKTDIEEGLPHIAADRKQIQEIFFNLIRNAAQSIENKGEILIRATNINNKVNIEIKDTGIGMDKNHLAQIFDSFFTTKEPGEGTGLGLFIVKQIVEKNEGRIAVKSELGVGTTFHLRFNTVTF
ncbi:MAG: ATP-binding protein [Candidatus Omnitrophota bacterium]|jgi:two-component system NtrC family sensor kinase